MNITDILARTGGLESIARELGVNTSQVEQGAAALAPAILGGLSKQAQGGTGEGGLGELLGRLGGGGLLDNVLSPQPTDVSRGNDVLGEIFGSKNVSRDVATHAANQTGLSSSLLKQMLPMIAMVVAGAMAKHAQGNPSSSGGGGGLGDLLGGLMGGGQRGGGLGGLASMLDRNGNGNPLDDILDAVGKLRR